MVSDAERAEQSWVAQYGDIYVVLFVATHNTKHNSISDKEICVVSWIEESLQSVSNPAKLSSNKLSDKKKKQHPLAIFYTANRRGEI